ncbi:seryl-tRNA synthetase [Quaeritorhiza haematococci]|nr:seryl-tRNA synthetase [Quaeritorhiza haematococci]
MRDRNVPSHVADVYKVKDLYGRVVAAEFELDKLRKRRNEVAAEVKEINKARVKVKEEAKAKAKGGVELKERLLALLEEGKYLKGLVQTREKQLAELHEELFNEAKHIPNDTAPDVPIGNDEAAAKVLGIYRGFEKIAITPEPTTDTLPPPPEPSSPASQVTNPQNHVDLAQSLDMVDFDRSGKVVGSGFYYLKNAGALLEMALARYAMDVCVRRGFVPILAPDIIRREVLDACGFAPRSDDPQTYFIQPHQTGKQNADGSQDSSTAAGGADPLQLCLSATAEFTIASMHANEILGGPSQNTNTPSSSLPSSSPVISQRQQLPYKYVAMSHCFRAEGLAGALNRGLYRVHQFTKVEMFAFSNRHDSDALLEEFLEIQKEIFGGLGLTFRVLNMPTGDLGAPAYKKYDIEAWMPGRKQWGEISSASNCTDFQSRRLNIRYWTHHNNPTSPSKSQTQTEPAIQFVHTINGTAAAIPRLILAILETFQTLEGDVIIPERLRPYFLGGGVERIRNGVGLGEMLGVQKTGL